MTPRPSGRHGSEKIRSWGSRGGRHADRGVRGDTIGPVLCRPPDPQAIQLVGHDALYRFPPDLALGDGVAGTHDDVIGSGETLLVDPPPFLLLSRGHPRAFSSKEEVDTKFAKTAEGMRTARIFRLPARTGTPTGFAGTPI